MRLVEPVSELLMQRTWNKEQSPPIRALLEKAMCGSNECHTFPKAYLRAQQNGPLARRAKHSINKLCLMREQLQIEHLPTPTHFEGRGSWVEERQVPRGFPRGRCTRRYGESADSIRLASKCRCFQKGSAPRYCLNPFRTTHASRVPALSCCSVRTSFDIPSI
jgi:hypothetical protein